MDCNWLLIENENMTEVKARYDPDIGIVDGYFPDNMNYPNNIIDEENGTIDGKPFISITSEEHRDNLHKKMCVIDQVFQEYIPTLSEQLINFKAEKISELEAQYISNLSAPILGGNVEGVPYYFYREKIKAKMAMIPILNDASIILLETTDNKIITLSKDEFILICSDLNESENNELIRRNTVKSAIEALDNIEEVQNYDITTMG